MCGHSRQFGLPGLKWNGRNFSRIPLVINHPKYGGQTMKISLLVALAELAIGLTVPVVAQQKDAVDQQTVHQRDLLGIPGHLASSVSLV
jgi:hypothetical protein